MKVALPYMTLVALILCIHNTKQINQIQIQMKYIAGDVSSAMMKVRNVIDEYMQGMY